MRERIIVVEVNGAERRVPLVAESLRIGRAASCDVCVDDDEVSREHAVLVWKGAHWNLRDRGSTNGTLLDGERVQGERPITAGQTIVVGGTRVRFLDLPAPGAGAITRRRGAAGSLELVMGDGWARVRIELGGETWDGPIPRQQARHLWLLAQAGRDERGGWRWVEMEEEFRLVSYRKDSDPAVPVHASRHRLRQWWTQVRQGCAKVAEQLPEDLLETQRHAVRLTLGLGEVRIPPAMP